MKARNGQSCSSWIRVEVFDETMRGVSEGDFAVLRSSRSKAPRIGGGQDQRGPGRGRPRANPRAFKGGRVGHQVSFKHPAEFPAQSKEVMIMADGHAKPQHDYHLVVQPLGLWLARFSALAMAIGAIGWMKGMPIFGHKVGGYVFFAGLIGVLFTMCKAGGGGPDGRRAMKSGLHAAWCNCSRGYMA